jgi:uncharacterized protein YidB (DUF937 family)
MGLLDELLAGALGGAMGQPAQARPQAPAAGGGDMGRILMTLLPVVLAMLAGRGGGTQPGLAPGRGGGGLEDILGQMLGGGAQRGRMPGGGLGDILGQVLGGGAAMGGGMRGGGAPEGLGGISDLLRQLDQSGYGKEAQSWVSTGDNLPIPPDAMSQIFGHGGLEAISQYTGLSERETTEGLSQILPEVVNHVTPNGEVPDFDQLSASVESLARRMRA